MDSLCVRHGYIVLQGVDRSAIQTLHLSVMRFSKHVLPFTDVPNRQMGDTDTIWSLVIAWLHKIVFSGPLIWQLGHRAFENSDETFPMWRCWECVPLRAMPPYLIQNCRVASPATLYLQLPTFSTPEQIDLSSPLTTPLCIPTLIHTVSHFSTCTESSMVSPCHIHVRFVLRF